MNIDAVGDLVAGGYFVAGAVVGLAVAIVDQLWLVRRSDRVRRADTAAAVAASVIALVGAYVCTPDTELARAFLGAIVAAGVVVLAAAGPWRAYAGCTTVFVVIAAVVDGRGRASAVVGTLATAVIHALAQAALARSAHGRDRPPRVAVGETLRQSAPLVILAVTAAAFAVTSRVAGLADSALIATAVAVPTLIVVAIALMPAPRAHTDD